MIKINGQRISEIIPSVLIALFFNVKVLSDGLISITGRSIMSYLYIAIFVFLCFYIVMKGKIKVSAAAMVLIAVLLLYYGLTIRTSRIEPIYFVVYIIMPFLFSLLQFDCEGVLKYTAIIASTVVVFQASIFRPDYIGSIEMGISYMFLPGIISAFLHFRYYRGNEKLWMWLVYIINAFYLLKIVMYGSRGPILAVALTVLVTFFVKYSEKEYRFKVNWGKLSAVLVVTVIFIVNFIDILSFVQEILSENGVEFRFIDKIINLNERNDITNGREAIFVEAFQGWLKKPLFGHGISSFDYYVGYGYPHNLLLQLLFDGGVFLTAIIFIPLFYNAVKYFKRMGYEAYIAILFLAMVSIPGALFSGDIFENYKLWLFIFMLLNYKSVFSRNMNMP